MTCSADAPDITIPILLYHSVSREPSSWIAPFTVSPQRFGQHLDLVCSSGRRPVTVSQLRDGLTGRGLLPSYPVVVTFDDGFADTLDEAVPLMAAVGVTATVYVTTGFVDGRSPGGDLMLGRSGVRQLASLGHEIGAHSVTHPQLDVLPAALARREIVECRQDLENTLGSPVRSFAYPHGYSSPRVRRMVDRAGFDSACAVRNVISTPDDPRLAISRLTVGADTRAEDLMRWLEGDGSRRSRTRDAVAVPAWRMYRRLRESSSRDSRGSRGSRDSRGGRRTEGTV